MMNNLCLRFQRNLLLASMLFFVPHFLSATTFTAVASGDWSNAVTWGGNAPGTNITAADQIIIELGVTVTLDVDVEINHQLALMTLLGTVESTDHELTVTAGTIAGVGDLIVKKITVGANGVILATGSVVVVVLETSSTSLLLSVDLQVQNELKITGGSFSLANTGSLLLGAGSTIELAGGSFMADTSLIQAASSINLVYSGSTQTSGPETTIGTIANLLVNLADQGDSLTLAGNVTVSDTLTLQSGYLVLNSHHLTLNGMALNSGQASIIGNTSAGLELNGTGDLTLTFALNGAILDSLIVNQSNGNVVLGNNLTVGSSLNLLQGSLVLNGKQLTLNGALNTQTGASITGSATSGLIFDGMSDVTVVFGTNAATLGTFTVSQLNGTVTLSDDLTVSNSFTLHQGTLVLDGHNLVSNGSFTGIAGASISGSATSGLILDGTGNAPIAFSANGALLDTLIVSQFNGNAILGTDLLVSSHLDLQQGTLSLNGNDLTVNGTFHNAAGASIKGNVNSALILEGNGDVSLVFAPNSALLDTLLVGQTNGNVSLTSNLTVGGLLDLQQGALLLNSNDLTLNGSLSTAASASITGAATAGLILDGTGNLSPVFTQNTALLADLVVSQSNGNVTLTSDLTVGNQVNLQQGSLLLNGYNLTVKGTLSTAAGASITGNGNSGLFLDGTGAVNLVFAPTTAALDTLLVSQTSGNVTLTSDLTVESLVNIQQGSLVLDGNDLIVHGMLRSSAGASITGGPTSGLFLDGQGNISLVFSPAGPVLDTLLVSQSNGFVSMTGDLTVGSLVNLQKGTLVLNGNDLTVNGTLTTASGASITGSQFSGLILNGTGDVSVFFAPNAASLSAFAVSQTNGNVSLSSNLTVSNNVSLQQGSLLLNGNNLTIKGSLTTAAGASITGSANSGLILDGNGNITLDFAANGAVLDTLVVSQTNGNVTLNNDLAIESQLNLQQGKLVLGDFDITLSNNAQVTGGSASSYVVTNGNGVYSAFVEAGGAGVTFPCGSASAYFPAIIAQGSGATDAQIEMNVGAGVLADGTTGADLTATESLVNHTWFVGAADANAQLDLNFKFLWNAAAEVNAFDHGACFISHFVNGSWDSHVVAQANAEANGYFSISRDHITTLSPFRVADATSSSVSAVLLRDFQVFPNPVSGDTPLTLRLDSPVNEKVQIRVMNAAGTVLMTENVHLMAGSNDYVLPAAGLGVGVYLVEMRGESERLRAVRRFVRQ